ncbi:MBL fold metallo-hydrolase [Chryseobacterium sp. PTM-20240506]|uniref:MBL fold metallo-hydrolase n=1 Tax=unclassified Chryseobacterium TaxID=2593645 RepID=UPI002358847E|nr:MULTISPECIES: MBL fold metallo-hydrolase [unclassified Chryseobacterium]MDC8103400.1 MBL fold metallo-hydrolase [Chryseobacterium sp. B21-037]MDQ1802957.1 MBL fold metallo-hydrolase [Chryseobacterium sp. CKR4-1]
MERNIKTTDTGNNILMTATYIGGPTVLLNIGGFRIMTDPTLDPEGTSFILNEKMKESKLSGPAIIPGKPVDIVLLSHDQHFDNLDNMGREYLKEVKATLTTKKGAERLKGNSIGLDPKEYIAYSSPAGDEIRITATSARHGPAGIEKLAGDVIGFHIAVSGKNNFELYITGDTVFYNEIENLGKTINPAYIFAFAGAARPRGPFNLTMGTNDVLDTAHVFPKSIIIPLHSEGWSHYTENNANLEEAFDILGIRERLQILKPGVETMLSLHSN